MMGLPLLYGSLPNASNFHLNQANFRSCAAVQSASLVSLDLDSLVRREGVYDED